MAGRYWRDLSTADIAALDTARAIAVLPVAAIEQHGPHLPLSVDADLNAGILARALALVPDDLPVLALPMQEIGKSNEHQAFPGTLTHSAEGLIRSWTEIAESVRRAGIRKLVIFNSHGGQPQIVDIVAVDLRVRLSMLTVGRSWFDLGLPDGLFPEDELAYGIHGGAVETSMMLHLHPNKVRRELLADFPSRYRDLAVSHPLVEKAGFAWMTQDLNASGAIGNAALADAEKGRLIVELAAERLAALLAEINTLPADLLKE
ncbi:creatininase family protein [Oceanibaculum indicum]|uniref:Creatinine amidohydrolase n=1 Tax=Oceanibaculum indicum P24 TaxID=1207063 RepID=K2J364_9PROT|nr:creatininase family protein [Oceanibaculum indicum]EKE69528.1 Creatinine amidohydrolase [Oceanibaculum indicum P24]